jgi:Family of unknown function (DUF6082)
LRLSAIGQTYGAVSAIISALALGGITLSIFLQAKEAKASRLHTLRTFHHEIMRYALDNPLYLECWRPAHDLDRDGQQQHVYVNLVMSFLQMAYAIDKSNEVPIRHTLAHEVFRTAPGRAYWAEAKPLRLGTPTSRTNRRFHQIVDEEFENAIRSDLCLELRTRGGSNRGATFGKSDKDPPSLRPRSWTSPAVQLSVTWSVGSVFPSNDLDGKRQDSVARRQMGALRQAASQNGNTCPTAVCRDDGRESVRHWTLWGARTLPHGLCLYEETAGSMR